MLKCGPKKAPEWWNCKIRYLRDQTPVVYFITPPVVYYEATTEVWFDQKNTMSYIKNLESDEKPFVKTEIGGSKLDFEFNVDSSTG